jgi:class 3 adenylate cyclase
MAGERRHATVMFADVSGFTTLSERLDPEVVTELMDGCFARMERAVDRYGGHVSRYIGDCIMAIFGAPTALENAARQAVNAAIDMRAEVETFGKQRTTPVPLELHIGINTGLVVAGDVGGTLKREFTAMGDSVNVASRLKDASPRGAIWVGAEVYRLTRGEFDYRRLPDLNAKGKEQPVEAYELTSLRPRVHRARPDPAERMIHSALVGRDDERERISACLARVAAGEGAIVSIVGDAGIGKSRLLAEIASGGHERRVNFLEGRSLSTGTNLSFHPFVDLFGSWAGITEEDAEEVACTRLRAAIEEARPPDPAEVQAFVATMMGMSPPAGMAERIAGMDGAALERMIRKSVRELIHALAQRTPLVLVFEDLHWADLSSIALLTNLLRLVDEVPVCFILLLRPGYSPATQHTLKLAREELGARHLEITLAPLDARECDSLLRNLLRTDDPPYAVRTLITRRAEGNPFYIEEVVRSLIDQGAIEHRADGFRATDKIQSVELPGTIHDVILTRIDRLPASARQLLQVASIIGRSFPHRVLTEVAPRKGDALEWELRDLKRRQILQERREGNEIQWVFKHALTQEAIYESILLRERRELHGTVAAAIESMYAERLADFYGMLAYHYSRAESLAKAEEYLFKAGADAARAAASNEALHFFQEASRVFLLRHGDGGDPGKKALLEKNIGLALLNKGDLPASVAHFDRALVLLGERVPMEPRARVRRFAADAVVLLARVGTNRVVGRARSVDREVFEIRYHRARAQTTSDPKRFFFDSIGTTRRMTETDPRAIDQACGMYTAVAAMIGWSGLSFALSKRFLAIASTLVQEGNPRDQFGYRSWKFVLHFLEGDWSDEHLVPEPLIDEALRWGQFWDVNTYRGLLCERHIHQGRFDAARAEMARIVELADVYGYDFARTNQYLLPTLLMLQQRDLAGALPMVERYYLERREELLNLLALGIKAKIQVLADDQTAAVDTLAAADVLLHRAGQAPAFHASMLAQAHLLHDLAALEQLRREGRTRLPRPLVRRARQHARRAVRLSASVARERPEAYRLTGTLAWLLGRGRRALRWWEKSLEAGRALGALPEVARTSLELGSRLVDAGQEAQVVAGQSAAAHHAEAGRIFVDLGLAPGDSRHSRVSRAGAAGEGSLAVGEQ